MKTQSVTSILAGGIAFFRPEDEAPSRPAKDGELFPLYEDFQSAAGHGSPIRIIFNSGDGLVKGSLIKYKGVTVGKVKALRLIDGGKRVEVAAILEAAARDFAREGTRFWRVGPALGLVNTENLDTLISGQYIGLIPGRGSFKNQFVGLESAPALAQQPQGLNITVRAARLGSLKRGNPVYYRQFQVGRVMGFDLGDSSQDVLIYMNIDERYAPLVRVNSRFWNVSGINIDFGLFRGLNVNTESLAAIVDGGIAFSTPNNDEMGRPATRFSIFKLHDELEQEWLDWSPRIKLPAGLSRSAAFTGR